MCACAGEAQRKSWLLCSAISGGRARSLALQAQQQAGARGLVPWAGIAAPLLALPAVQNGLPAGQEQGEGKGGDKPPGSVEGQAFCFLPLPCLTGVPPTGGCMAPILAQLHGCSLLSHCSGRMRSAACQICMSDTALSCSCPALPAGLPVHVNGYFELRQDRTALNTDKGMRSDWNLALLEVRLLLTAESLPFCAAIPVLFGSVWAQRWNPLVL